MKKIGILLLSLLTVSVTLQSCEDMDDNAVPVNDFIWKGLNQFYLWQSNVPNLADNRFANQAELNAFLESYNTPSALFESLLYRTDSAGNKVDRFSVLVEDYRVLENALQGVSMSNGIEFGLVYKDDTRTSVFGYVRYVMPGSDASTKDIKRGDIFYAVNGTALTGSNYYDLLVNQNFYTLNMAEYDGGNITPNDKTVALTKTQYSENPVLVAKTITAGSHTIGYLMYNGFYSNYDTQLNDAFGQFAAAGVTDLVLDLRYNGGGSVRTATYLGSMITGQFNGQIFCKEQWNSKLQAYYESNNPESLVNKFSSTLSNGSSINSLRLNKVYIIATGSTASASELVINGLKPYIEVQQIGKTTVGKNVGSITLYDSPDFSAKNRNGSHRYAMQPIVFRIANKNDFGDYASGIKPNVELGESFDNMGMLGNETEPLLAEAIHEITGSGRRILAPETPHVAVRDSKSIRPLGNDMYTEVK